MLSITRACFLWNKQGNKKNEREKDRVRKKDVEQERQQRGGTKSPGIKREGEKVGQSERIHREERPQLLVTDQ